MTRATVSTLASLVPLLFAHAAAAQVYYGGYNLGPDYGAMIQQQLQQQQQMNQQMEQQAQAVVAQAMQNPECQARYREYLAGGGTLPYAQFAYQYVATAGFSSDGIARFRRSEADNQRREANALAGVRDAEAATGAALAERSEHFADNQRQAGDNLRGNGNWIDPNDGSRRTLSYLGENAAYTDPQSGRVYQRDVHGNYFVQGADGLWYPMAPAR